MSQQSRQEFPEGPLVDESKMIKFNWMGLLRSMYNKTGGGNSSDNTAVYLQLDPGGVVNVYNVNGIKLGKVTLS